MAKQTNIAALLLVLLGLAAAVTTTMTTTTMEEKENTGKFPQCRQQVEGRDFRYCQMFLMQRTTYNDGTLLNMVVTSSNRREQPIFKKKCCEQLRGINSQCVCDAVRHMVKQQKGEKTVKMKKKASMLPRMCNIRKQPCPRY